MRLEIAEIIPLAQTSGGHPTVNARDLHEFMGIRKDFSTWIKDRLKQCRFVESRDFVCSPNLGSKGRGGQNRFDYHLGLTTAKHIAMMERNEKGFQAREYFIQCEEALRSRPFDLSSLSFSEVMQAVIAKWWHPSAPAGLWKQVLPLGRYGEIAPNGRPRTGFKRSAWVAAQNRTLEAMKLATQLQMLTLMQETESQGVVR